MKDLPSADWLNGFRRPNHQREPTRRWSSGHTRRFARPHEHDTGVVRGHMPDLNQGIFVSRYLIENTLWWIESTGLGRIREDTYSYVEQKFHDRLGGRINASIPRSRSSAKSGSATPCFLPRTRKRAACR